METWPIEYSDQLILGSIDSNIGICCLWSSKTRLQAMLSPYDYAVIGNLYSRAGINAMLRNILANPLIRYLVLTGKSLTDSGEALTKFFVHGVDDDFRVIGSGAQIDRDLSLEALNDIRQNVELIDLRNTLNFKDDFVRTSDRLSALPPFAEPRRFPTTPHTAPVFPSEFTGFIVRRRTICEAWSEAIWTVMTFGCTSPTDYGLEQKEILALLSIIENPADRIDNAPHWAPFKREEALSYVEKFFDPHKNAEVAYNYGYRLQTYWGADQVESIAAELVRSGHSRRALANLWNPTEDSKSVDPVCLITIQAVVRDGRLHLMTYIRSHDVFRAYPLNAVALAALQMRIAGRLGGAELGPLEILSYSAHIYSDCWEACKPALAEESKLRRAFEQDQRGSFVFRIDDGHLVADHFSPDGDLVQTFTAKSEKELTSLIAPFVSRVDHGMYLAQEIARLASAFASGNHYEQDRVEH
jgi:thymidylate synthase